MTEYICNKARICKNNSAWCYHKTIHEICMFPLHACNIEHVNCYEIYDKNNRQKQTGKCIEIIRKSSR